MKTPFSRIAGVNLLLMLLVAIVPSLQRRGVQDQLGVIVVSAWVYVGLGIINIGLAIGRQEPAARRAHWLSVLLALLIGFGNCAWQFSR